MRSGYYRLMNFDLSNHFEEDMLLLEKFKPNKPLSAVYYNAEKSTYFLKRFLVEATDKKTYFIGEEKGSILVAVSSDWLPVLLIRFDEKLNKKPLDDEEVKVSEFIDIMGFRAKGKRLSNYAIKRVELLEPLPFEEPEIELPAEEPDVEEVLLEEEADSTPWPEETDNFPKAEKPSGDDPDDIQMTLEF